MLPCSRQTRLDQSAQDGGADARPPCIVDPPRLPVCPAALAAVDG
jgi:hypothetical protein